MSAMSVLVALAPVQYLVVDHAGFVRIGLLEIVVLRPLYRRGALDQVLATFGLILFFNEAVTVIWGRESIPLSIPPFLTGSVEIIPGGAYPIFLEPPGTD